MHAPLKNKGNNYVLWNGCPPPNSVFQKVKFFICGAKTNVGISHMLRFDAYYR